MMRRLGQCTLTLLVSALALTGCASGGESEYELGDPRTDEYLASDRQALADSLGIATPPPVAPSRLLALDEWAPTLIECLRDAGFDARETPDGEGVAYPPIEDAALRESLNLAIYTCEARYPVSPKYMEPLNHEQLTRLYSYRTRELIECLREEGFVVSEPPPSETAFVESGGAWSPHAFLPVLDDDDTRRVSTACPQVPRDLYDG